ncbi:MAG TPA: S9 family peptidase [Gemmatales bacterium]|nr:S9 family peptidase [Gemmatales bacterium]
MHLRFASLFIFWFLVTALIAQDKQRSITAEDLWKVKRVGNPSTSPDGRWAVVDVSTTNMDKNESTSELWLLSTDGKTQKQLTRSGGRNSHPKWSPDGQYIAFLSQRTGDENTQIYVISTSGGEARRVSNMPMAPYGIKWSADSTTIFCTAWTWSDTPTDEAYQKKNKERRENKVQAYIIEEGIFRYWDRWIADGKRPVVWAVDLSTGKHRNLLAHCRRHLPPYEASERDYDVSPDGKTLAFVSENVEVLGLDTNHDIYTLDLTMPDAQAVNITEENQANDTHPAYSPDGKYLAFLRQTTKFFYADKFRLMLRETSTGTTKELSSELDRSCNHPVWVPDSKRIAVEVEDSGITNIAFATLDGKITRPRESFSERGISFAHGNEERVGVYVVSSFDRPPGIVAHRPGSKAHQIDHFNDDLVREWKLGKVESLTFQGADNREIQMFLVYPPDFDASKKWPLVQMVHGGPHNAFTNDFSFRWHPHVWAAQGWVIAIVNFHGSSGFGQEFTDSITGDLGTKPMIDIMKSTEFLCAKPWIDKTRVAAAGASYGGYMMAWLNGHTDFFRAMVCHAGVYNWHSMVASDLVRGRDRSLGAPPWGDLTKVDAQNAQRFAANFKTPTLVIHGEKDYRVPVTQGMEYYNTLRQKGVPTRFLYFPDENHWVLKAQNSLLWHKEVFAWLGKYIGHGPSN